jgi:hypothetical protein
MKKIEEVELREKLNGLFSDSEESYKDARLNQTERSELVDLSEEEIKEVAEYVQKIENKKSPKKRYKFTFSFVGKILFNFILILLEILIVSVVLFLFFPNSINKDVTYLDWLSITIILAVLKQWFQK